MVLCNVECVQKISQYLGVPSRKYNISENNILSSIPFNDAMKNCSIKGFSTIVQALAKESRNPDAVGRDKVEKALVRQWLEYAVLYLNYADHPANSRRIFKELNAALQRNTYICGTSETIADIALYYCLHSIMKGLTHQEKAEYVNVSRWFDNIQQNEKTRQKLELINFDLLYLYV